MKKIQVIWSYLKTRHFNGFKTRAELERYQEKKIEKHLSFLKKRSSYFQKHPAVLSELPIMDKKIMMNYFNELNTVAIKKEEAFELALKAEKTRDFSAKIGKNTIGLSSGTSGNRGLFLVSESEQNHWAGTILAKMLPNGFKENETIAFFLRANSNLYESVKSKKVRFVFFDLLDELEVHLNKLNKEKPTILAAPPSMMRILAEEKQKGILEINPKKIITMAEVLDPVDEEYISKIFNRRVHQVYQCTEGFLASTCSHGTLHLNEDIVYIEKEFLDTEKRKFIPIITDFSRKAQPIVRYRLNDILTLKREKCECGSVMTGIEQIEGRCDDIFYFKKLEQEDLVPVFPDFIRRAIITASLSIKEYRVIQHSIEKIEVQITTEREDDEIEEKVKDTIKVFLSEKEVQLPEITFKPYEEKDKITKLKRVERMWEL